MPTTFQVSKRIPRTTKRKTTEDVDDLADAARPVGLASSACAMGRSRGRLIESERGTRQLVVLGNASFKPPKPMAYWLVIDADWESKEHNRLCAVCSPRPLWQCQPPERDLLDRRVVHERRAGSRLMAISGIGRLRPLDGIRALAVLAVVATHSHIPKVHGGGFGVDAFFALSGFLITSLLLQEFARAGTIDRRAFYVRRALRLLPALAVMIVVTVILDQTAFWVW